MTSEGIELLVLRSVENTLSKEAEALSQLADQYKFDDDSRSRLTHFLGILKGVVQRNGRIYFVGVGKSLKLGSKLLATMNSLSISSQTLHATEALHGDMGGLRENDAIILLSASGSTPELVQMLPYLHDPLPILLICCKKESYLSSHPKVCGSIYAKLSDDLNENNLHGLPAPTVSATLTLALGDSVIMALAEQVNSEIEERKSVFLRNHPGGTIGVRSNGIHDGQVTKIK